jgi:TonB family protein
MRGPGLPLFAVLLTFCLALPGLAFGQAPQDPGGGAQPLTLRPPVPRKNEGAAYPKQALDEGYEHAAQVSVLITVSELGAVTEAVVERPVGHGFDEAALEAARGVQFEPATRNGVPVAARTRIVYAFSPPPGSLSGQVLSLAGERPIEGAPVNVRDSTGTEQDTTTDAQGRWRFEGLAPGQYQVRIAANGREPHESTQHVGPGQEVAMVDRLAPFPQARPPGSADGGTDGAAEEAEEVEAHSEKPPREVTKYTLSQNEINRIPGTGGDALRSLQNLPGVARPPPLSGFLLVRGAAPEDTQVFVDGTPIPIVYHFGGIKSVLPTEVIDKIDFFPGNFSTQYGRAMGGAVDVNLTDPKSDKLHGLAMVDLIDSRVVAQGPIFDTGWKFAIAGRRSYVDTWLGPVLKAAGENVTVAPVYYDYQAILERDLDKHSSIRFALFGSDDRLALLLTSTSSGTPTLAGQLSTHTAFWRGQALYKNRIDDNTDFRVVAAIGQDHVDFSAGDIFFNLTDWPVTARAEISRKLDPQLTMNMGLDVIYAPYSFSAQLPPLPTPGQPPPGPLSSQPPRAANSSSSIYEPAAYVEWEATPWTGARIVPGLRLDYTKDTRSWDFDPRVTVRQDVTTSPRTTLKLGVGLFSQPPQPQETNAVFGTPGLVSNRVYQYALGVERELGRQVNASIEGFYKQLDHIVVQGLGNTGSGVIYGGEALLRYNPDAHFFGWATYTLSRSTLREAPGMPLELSTYDETHVLTVLGSYRLGRGWEFGARYRLTSGFLYTPEQYGFYDENVGAYVPMLAYPQNASRLPLFHSLDLRVDKTWRFRWGKLGAYLEVWNVYNNANADGMSYDFNQTHTSFVDDLPILPSLGFWVEM